MKKTIALAGLLLLAAAPASADGMKGASYANPSLPAVSGLNGKLEGFGGEFADESLGAVAGSISFPLSKRYGLQIDGLAGSLGGDNMFGVGAHLFWRDPAHGLLGVYGDYVRWEGFGGNEVHRLAAEGELYRGRFSFESIVGVEFGELKDRVFARSNIAYYPHDDMRLFVGHRYLGGDNALALGAEWQVAPRGIALFAEGQIADEDNGRSILGGVRIYLGREDKSLIRRHREDDPANDLKNAGQSIGGNLNTWNKKIGFAFKGQGTPPDPCAPQ